MTLGRTRMYRRFFFFLFFPFTSQTISKIYFSCLVKKKGQHWRLKNLKTIYRMHHQGDEKKNYYVRREAKQKSAWMEARELAQHAFSLKSLCIRGGYWTKHKSCAHSCDGNNNAQLSTITTVCPKEIVLFNIASEANVSSIHDELVAWLKGGPSLPNVVLGLRTISSLDLWHSLTLFVWKFNRFWTSLL